jgi:glycerophosphoryl diester phosphodiesterase
MSLPARLIDRPVTHRALHDRAAGRVENSPSAIQAAIAGGWGIEIDVQLTSDARAMVFHDDALDRLTGETGPVNALAAGDLTQITLSGGDEVIPTLPEVLKLVAGQVPLMIEIKDQDGALGPNVGPLEAAVAENLLGYEGDVAVMSFNPHAVAEFGRVAPDIPRGLVTGGFNTLFWPGVPVETCDRLRTIPDFDRVGAQFISHEVTDLTNPAVAALKARGVPILCWTVRSADVEREARKIADNVTFEGYIPA